MTINVREIIAELVATGIPHKEAVRMAREEMEARRKTKETSRASCSKKAFITGEFRPRFGERE